MYDLGTGVMMIFEHLQAMAEAVNKLLLHLCP